MIDLDPTYTATLEIRHGSFGHIQIARCLDSDVRLRTITYRDSKNWTTNLLANSNCHKFWMECRWRPIIYQDARDERRKLQGSSNGHNFWLEYRDTRNWTRKLEHIQTAITFDMDVSLRPNIYRDAWNSTRKLWENSNYDKSWIERPIAACNISRIPKLNTDAPGKFKWP